MSLANKLRKAMDEREAQIVKQLAATNDEAIVKALLAEIKQMAISRDRLDAMTKAGTFRRVERWSDWYDKTHGD